MAGQQEIQVQQKREFDKAQGTRPMRAFLPTTDIFETDDALTVVLEMPGVDRDDIEVSVENEVLQSKARSNSTSIRAFSQCIANTTSVPIGEAFVSRAGSIRTKFAPR
jgi:HSP20 family molecular chaperone IbpA